MKETSIEPIFTRQIEGVFLAATLDTRHSREELFPVSVRVTYKRKVWYYRTGIKLTPEAHLQVLRSKGVRGEFAQIKNRIEKIFDRVAGEVISLLEQNMFSLEALKSLLSKRNTPSDTTLLDYWLDYAETKKAAQTKNQFISAASSFYRSLGCEVRRIEERDPHARRKTIVGASTKIPPRDVTIDMIQSWIIFMEEQGNTLATQSFYLRAFRGVLYELQRNRLIRSVPKFKIPEGERRQDDFLTVPDIIKIRDYPDGPNKWSADWWIILYLCNGSNLRDLATLEYDEHYFHDNELSFVRAKTRNKKPVRVFIPIIPELEDLLKKYAAEPKMGQRVFPQILLNAQTDAAITNRVHDFNADIRNGMIKVCRDLNIRAVSASTARNSYITTLTWHMVSDAFIDGMVGHSNGKNILRGYQGMASPRKRREINSKLFIDPESY
ncbi:MAG TPA: hypothetical protein PK941_07090 [Paludibacter sp.]|nr:hypothetical protein [Paludibacter sp.]